MDWKKFMSRVERQVFEDNNEWDGKAGMDWKKK